MPVIEVVKGDITKIKADAIVNAANSSLMGGGGVDGAIHRAGGPEIMRECRQIAARQGGCKTGEAVITNAGNLPAKYVIHTVGPVWHGGTKGEPELLQRCYINSIRLAMEHQCREIAFPAISTGIYGFPKKLAANIAVRTLRTLVEKQIAPETILLVCFDHENYQYLREAIQADRAT